jgi:hypothetical protein
MEAYRGLKRDLFIQRRTLAEKRLLLRQVFFFRLAEKEVLLRHLNILSEIFKGSLSDLVRVLLKRWLSFGWILDGCLMPKIMGNFLLLQFLVH